MRDYKVKYSVKLADKPAAEDKTSYLCSRLIFSTIFTKLLLFSSLLFFVSVSLAPSAAAAARQWKSYEDPARNKPCNNFKNAEQSTVYMKGTGFKKNHQYLIAYFDARGRLVKIDTGTLAKSDGYGVLDESFCRFPDYPRAKPGQWHAIVYNAVPAAQSEIDSVNGNEETSDEELSDEELGELEGLDASGSISKNGKIKDIVAIDKFHVAEGAIPEFSSVLGAVAICGACGLTYIFLRRKRCLNEIA